MWLMLQRKSKSVCFPVRLLRKKLEEMRVISEVMVLGSDGESGCAGVGGSSGGDGVKG